MNSYWARYNPIGQFNAGYVLVKVVAHYGKKALILPDPGNDPDNKHLVYRCNLDAV